MLDWTKDTARTPDHSLSEARGILVGTSIATLFGWRPIEAVCAGDQILTFKNGFQTVQNMYRVLIWHGRGDCPEQHRPIALNAGVLNNNQPVKVLPDQLVADEHSTLCPRALLEEGIANATKPHSAIEAIVLEFDGDEVIYDQVGLHYVMPKAGCMS